nr:short transient receptor potential channel 4 [Biomphalaria glabrata]
MMEELGMDAGEDFLGMGVFRKDVDLTNEEKQYLLSVERGDVPSTRQYLNNSKQTGMNLNCLDPLGRTALLVAIENENIEMIELLLSYGVEVGDALLHAINEENVEAVELLLNHELATKGEQQPLTTTVPSSSFTPDITPIILAGHRDNYEIIKILLDRGYRIPKPHNARCSCKDCITGSQEDSLRHSRSRINAYKALASPSLICLSSKDPILTSFELSCELKQLSKLENEFKADYEKLAVKCQEFAVDLLEQTRGSRELAIILNHDNTTTDEQNCDKVRLSRLKLAIKYKQKKVVLGLRRSRLTSFHGYDAVYDGSVHSGTLGLPEESWIPLGVTRRYWRRRRWSPSKVTCSSTLRRETCLQQSLQQSLQQILYLYPLPHLPLLTHLPQYLQQVL